MKKIVFAICALFGLTSAFGGQRFDAATWKNVPTSDVPTLLKQETSLLGRVVAVKNVSVYGHVEKDADNNFVQLRLLGTKVTTDAAGNATIDW